MANLNQFLRINLLFIGFTNVLLVIKASDLSKSPADVHVVYDSNNQKPLTLHVNAFGDTHKVNLIPAPPIFSKHFEEYTVTTDEHGQHVVQHTPDSTKSHEDIQSRIFTDDTGATSVHIETKNGKPCVEGIINGHMKIEPIDNPENTTDGRHVAHRTEGAQNVLPQITNIKIVPPHILGINNTTVDEERKGPDDEAADVELLVMYDYLISAHFQMNNDKMKKYIAVFYGTVARRYLTVPHPRISFRITCLLKTTDKNNEFLVRTGGKIDAEATLEAFGKWLHKQEFKKKYDVAYFHTGFDVVHIEDDKSVKDSTGLGYLAGACLTDFYQTFSASIGEDMPPGMYLGTFETTHGIGHVLGADDDGEDHFRDSFYDHPSAKTCPAIDGHIMSETLGKNTFTFSTCSLEAIKYNLGLSEASCVFQSESDAAITPFSKDLPGKSINLNKQCNIRFGPGYQKKIVTTIADVCTTLWCEHESGGKKPETKGPAFEGSSCGTNKICYKGKCTLKPAVVKDQNQEEGEDE